MSIDSIVFLKEYISNTIELLQSDFERVQDDNDMYALAETTFPSECSEEKMSDGFDTVLMNSNFSVELWHGNKYFNVSMYITWAIERQPPITYQCTNCKCKKKNLWSYFNWCTQCFIEPSDFSREDLIYMFATTNTEPTFAGNYSLIEISDFITDFDIIEIVEIPPTHSATTNRILNIQNSIKTNEDELEFLNKQIQFLTSQYLSKKEEHEINIHKFFGFSSSHELNTFLSS
jgi:hypothetical protein